jgi:circadian clock protein KaiB
MISAGPQNDRAARVHMTLFIAGSEANSRRARDNLARLCEEELDGAYELDVIDVLEDYQAAAKHNVMVTPTLIVSQPPPPVTILGDLRNTERLRTALRLN